MKYSVKYKKVFDKENHIVDICSVTPETKMSEYYSIGTHTPMTVALGKKNQHYFRAKRGYALNPETELHQYAKNILKHRFDNEEKFLIRYYRKDTCPFGGKCIFYDEQNGGCEMLEERLIEYDLKQFYDRATIEKSYEVFTADVLLSNTQLKRRPVFLEVAVTHPCAPEKIASGIKVIELFVEKEDDAYCYLEESKSTFYYDEKVRVKFHNFERDNVLKECPHHVIEKKYFPQNPIVLNKPIPTKYYCLPHQVSDFPLQSYYNNVEIGMLFASNKYAKPFVFDKAMCPDNKHFIILGKDIYGAVKPWVLYCVMWNGRTFYYEIQSHFDYKSALKVFTLAQGKEWHGGDTLSDEC